MLSRSVSWIVTVVMLFFVALWSPKTHMTSTVVVVRSYVIGEADLLGSCATLGGACTIAAFIFVIVVVVAALAVRRNGKVVAVPAAA
jgi:hypothetical protein